MGLFDLIGDFANSLSKMDKKVTGKAVADLLNTNGQKTKAGTDYAGKRGTYKTLSDAYNHFENKGDKKTAANIAKQFVTKDKHAAWEKKNKK